LTADVTQARLKWEYDARDDVIKNYAFGGYDLMDQVRKAAVGPVAPGGHRFSSNAMAHAYVKGDAVRTEDDILCVCWRVCMCVPAGSLLPSSVTLCCASDLFGGKKTARYVAWQP
jgi:hypothetical protein